MNLTRTHLLIALSFLLIPIKNSFAESNINELLPPHVTVIGRDEFVGRNFYTVADFLPRIKSIYLEKEGSRGSKTRTHLRAGEANQVTILMNGRPLNRLYNGEVDLNQIPLNLIEKIVISRSGASHAYTGEGIGGVINIITSRPSQDGLLTDIGTLAGRDGVKNSQGRIFGRAYLGDATFMSSLGDSSGFQENEVLETTTHFGDFTRSFNGTGYWGAQYYYNVSDIGVPNGTPVPMDVWNGRLERVASTPYRSREQENQHIEAHTAYPLLEAGTFYLNLTHSFRTNKIRAVGNGPAILDEKFIDQRANLRWMWGNFEAGAETVESTVEVFPDVRHKLFQTGFYGYHKFLMGRTTILPSLRWDHYTKGGSQLNPRLTVVSPIGNAFSLTGAVARIHRAPTFDDLFLSTGNAANPNLDSEHSWNTDVGFTWNPSPIFNLSTNGFYRHMEDGITLDETAGKVRNIGETEVLGTEMEFRSRFGEGNRFFNMTLEAQWTYQRSRVNEPGGVGFVPSALTPTHLISGRVIQYLPRKISLENEILYQGTTWQLADHQGIELSGHSLWNIRLRFHVLKAILFAEVENVMRRRYVDTLVEFTPDGGSPTVARVAPPERTYWAGLQINFEN